MADNNGYLKLYRSMTKWEWYKDTITKIVFLHLLLNANWEPSRYMGYEVPKGGLVIGRKKLAETLEISERQVRTALEHLKSTNEITIKTTNRFSIVTIVNWEKYQGLEEETTNKTTNTKSNKRPTSDQQTTTEEEIKNIRIKEDNNISYEKILNLYNELCPSLPKVTKITDARKKLINARLKDYSMVELEKAFKEAEASDFLTGRNGKWGGASFDWIMNTNNIVKILEGNYRNKAGGNSGYDLYRNTKKGNYDFEAMEKELKHGSSER